MESQRPAVWKTDAPDGYVGIVVYDAAESLLMRLEIRSDVYKPVILPPLQDWAQQNSYRLQLLTP